MATREQLLDALRRADAAGDTAAAQAIARRLQSVSATPAEPAPAAQVPAPQAAAPAAQEGPLTLEQAVEGNWGSRSSRNKGHADAVIKAAMGIGQFFGGLSDESKAVLRELEADQAADPNKGQRKVGEIGGNLLLTAVPGAKAQKLLQGAGTVGKIRGMAAAAGASGLTDGVTSVGEGDGFVDQMVGKAKNAGKAALAGGVLHGALNAAAVPFRATAEAIQLFRQGINPTLQQGAEGTVPRFIGGLTAGASKVRDRQEREVADALLRRVTDGNRAATEGTGREYLAQADDYVDQGYQALFQGKRMPLSPRALGNAVQAAQHVNARGQFQQEARQAGRQVGNIIGPGNMNTVNRNVNYDTLRNDYLQPLSRAGYAEPNEEIARRILEARASLLNDVRNPRLSADEMARLRELDVKNFDVERIREAIRGAADEEGITISRLAGPYGRKEMAGNTTREELIAPALRVLGHTPRQDEARTALVTAGRIAAPLGVGTGATMAGVPGALPTLAGLYGISALGQTAGGARALMGQTNVQQALARLLRERAIASGVTPSIMDQEYQDAP